MISTIDNKSLLNIFQNSKIDFRNLDSKNKIILLSSHNNIADVIVINFGYKNKAIEINALGFLVPITEVDAHPLLGVVFDSCPFPNLMDDSKFGTNLTLMIGGHHFENIDYNKDEDYWIEKSIYWLKKYLNIIETPVVTNFQIQYSCISQYSVGHLDRIIELNNLLRSEFNDRLFLTGASYNGVAINDCIYNSKKLSENSIFK